MPDPNEEQRRARTPELEADERVGSELEAAKHYADSLVDAMRDPLLVLGWDLRVKTANDPFCQTFEVDRRETEGRLIFELGNGQWNIPRLRELLQDILPEQNELNDFQVQHKFERIGERTMLLNARRLDQLQFIVLVIEDITERRRAERAQNVLMGELHHRVKNILTSVRALVEQTARGRRTLKAFTQVFNGRLDALARSQDLLLRSSDQQVALDEVLRFELGALGAEEGAGFTLEGPPVKLPARAAPIISMMIHELTTNAAKYGALSSKEGRIEIRWRTERWNDSIHLWFQWREYCVGVQPEPRKKGFGTEIIENSLPYLFGGSSLLTFHPDGIECVLNILIPTDANPMPDFAGRD